MDGCVFVIDAAKSRRRAVRHAREALDRAGAHVLGAVLNRVPVGFQTGYGGYYGDAYGADVGPGSAKVDPGSAKVNRDQGDAAERPAT